MKYPLLNEYRNDVYNLATASATELHCTCSESEQSVIFTDADICSWVENSSALANKNFAALYYLTTKTLDTKVLSI
jgi:hypothetical protein